MLATLTALTVLGAAPGLSYGLEGLDHDYRYIGGEHEIRVQWEQIEVGIADLFPLWRWIARGRIRDAERPSEVIHFTVADSKIVVERPGRHPDGDRHDHRPSDPRR